MFAHRFASPLFTCLGMSSWSSLTCHLFQGLCTLHAPRCLYRLARSVLLLKSKRARCRKHSLPCMIPDNLTWALPIFTKSSRLPSQKSRSRPGRQKCRDGRGRARREKPQTHEVTISTSGEIFLRNHASSSGLPVG